MEKLKDNVGESVAVVPPFSVPGTFISEMAERVGFEPTIPRGYTAFRERRLKPLGHLSSVTSISHPVLLFKM